MVALWSQTATIPSENSGACGAFVAGADQIPVAGRLPAAPNHFRPIRQQQQQP